jgi:CheY-like chemotaxis protein
MTDRIRHRVIVAEWHRELRESVEQLLEADGYEVLTASTSSQALALLGETGAPCVLLMDLRDENAQAWHILARLEQFPAQLKPHHVVALASTSNAILMERRFGCTVFASLPDAAELSALIDRHCGHAMGTNEGTARVERRWT